MTVTVTDAITSATGDGTAIAIPTVFVFQVAADIEVVERVIATGVETVKVLTTDYTVSGGGGAGAEPATGTVTAVSTVANTLEWHVRRISTNTQGTDLPTSGALPSASVEDMSDRLTLIAQQHTRDIDRSLKMPKTDSTSLDMTIPNSVDRASKYLTFDSSGNPTATASAASNLADGSAAAPSLFFADDTDTGGYRPGDNILALVTGGTEAMRIDSSGRAGIGETVPEAKLHVTSASATQIWIDSGGVSGFSGVRFEDGATFNGGIFVDMSDDSVCLFTRSDGSNPRFQIEDGSGEAMRITGGGLVGIGTTSPGTELEIAGDYQPLTVNSTTGSNAKIILQNNGTTIGYLGAGSGVPFIVHRSSDAGSMFQFKDLNGYSQLHFAASTTAGGGAGGAYLQALGSNAASPPQIAGIDMSMTDGTAGSESGIIAFHTTNSGTSAERMRIDSSGNLGIGEVSPGGKVHIKTGDAGAVTAGGAANELVIEGDGSGSGTGISILTPSDASGRIYFGNPDSDYDGVIQYIGAADRLEFWSDATRGLYIDSSQNVVVENGNLGIGTSAPGSLVDIDGADGIPFTLRGTSSSASLGMGLTSTSVVIQAQTTAAESTSMVFKTAPSSGTETEAMRITGDGNVGIGTASPGAELEIAGDYTPLIVNSTNSSNYKIKMENNGTGHGYLGGASTAPIMLFDGSAAELMRINSSGTLRPGADNSQSLGDASYRWSEVFAGNGTINTSDEREKTEIADLDEAERRVATALKGLVKKYKYKDAVAKKGSDAARIHVGVIAQEVVAAFSAEGLDAHRYALLCHDEWDAVEEVLNDDGEVVTPAFEAGDRYGIRYDELLAFIISAL